MDRNESVNPVNEKYVEAETVSEDSEFSSLSNFTDAVSEVNPFLDGINKVKELIQELEVSFHESSNIGNNLILRCVLLRAENQNLVYKIDERNRNLSIGVYGLLVLGFDSLKHVGANNVSPLSRPLRYGATFLDPPRGNIPYARAAIASNSLPKQSKGRDKAIYCKKNWQLSVLSQNKHKTFDRNSSFGDKTKIICPSQSKTITQNPVPSPSGEEIEILHETIEDLHKKLRERDKKIEGLCQKYLYLKTNKSKMENDLKSKILSLEKQLELTYSTLNEFQQEVDSKIGKSMSATGNIYEALFLQEKLRCSKLMYEKVKLNHEIKRLEDCIRRLGTRKDNENGCWDVIKCSIDKSNSEPLMKHF